ncbi:MAG: WbqC family protein [bacterium]
MLVAIHQPHYLPWLRYFHKIMEADLFILLDDAQFVKGEWHNRNKIKSAGGAIYLTVPIVHRFGQEIRETQIENTIRWREKHLYAFKTNYGNAPYFKEYLPSLFPFYEGKSFHFLGELNEEMLKVFLSLLGIKTPLIRSSQIGVEGKGNEKILNLCKAVGADAYLTGEKALEEYLDLQSFKENGIEVWVQRWKCPLYPQRFPRIGFIPDLAIVDLLFNCGEESLRILREGGDIERVV